MNGHPASNEIKYNELQGGRETWGPSRESALRAVECALEVDMSYALSIKT